MFLTRCSSVLIASLAVPFAMANQANLQSAVDAFMNCDSSFFHQLKSNANDFSTSMDLVVQDDFAYIPVEDVTQQDKSSYTFSNPIHYRGLTLTGFQNIYIETPLLGTYYYWGFIVDNSRDEVKNSLSQFNWVQYNETSDITNSKIYHRQDKNPHWENNPYSVDGIAPQLMTVEQSLTVLDVNETQTSLICSIQGDIPEELLYSIRPDMKLIHQAIEAKQKAEFEARKQLKQQQDQQLDQQENNSDEAI